MTTEKSSAFSLTVWMPPYTEETAKEMLARAQQLHPRWSIEGQMEKGHKSGKLHYQLMVKVKGGQERLSALRKAFPSCHVEVARNTTALEQYVHKQDTQVAEFKKIECAFVRWPDLRKKFFEWMISNEDVMSLSYTSDEDKMSKWDEFIGLSIEEGMEVDVMGVNPQYRSCIIRYWDSYARRGVELLRQMSNDKLRQTDTQEVSLPTIV